jgi:hypothetical protein
VCLFSIHSMFFSFSAILSTQEERINRLLSRFSSRPYFEFCLFFCFCQTGSPAARPQYGTLCFDIPTKLDNRGTQDGRPMGFVAGDS